jgi:transposase
MIDLVRAGRTPAELSREFDVSANSIRIWVRQSGRDEGRRDDGLTTAETEELRRLSSGKNRQLREEREILKKAAAWFARETDAVPPKSSGS